MVLSVTGILVDLSVAIMQVHFVAIMQLEVSAKHMHVAVSAGNMLTFFCLLCRWESLLNCAGGIFYSALCI